MCILESSLCERTCTMPVNCVWVIARLSFMISEWLKRQQLWVRSWDESGSSFSFFLSSVFIELRDGCRYIIHLCIVTRSRTKLGLRYVMTLCGCCLWYYSGLEDALDVVVGTELIKGNRVQLDKIRYSEPCLDYPLCRYVLNTFSLFFHIPYFILCII